MVIYDSSGLLQFTFVLAKVTLATWQMVELCLSLRDMICVSSGCVQLILVKERSSVGNLACDYCWFYQASKLSSDFTRGFFYRCMSVGGLPCIVYTHAARSIIFGDLAYYLIF